MVRRLGVLPWAGFVLVSTMGFQAAGQSLNAGLTGKEVVVKIDMPGTQKGVDLRFNKDQPMNWKEYSGRLKEYGVALHKGQTARITSVVQKSDMIEVQLDGGGFGTFGDDTTTTVAAKKVEKSDYEKRLEDEIASTSDDDKRRDLQRELDRERARRERENTANERDAKYASEEKSAKVAEDRARGGSRFNLRWSGSIPEADRTPEGLMATMSEYLTLADAAAAQGGPGPSGADTGMPGTAPEIAQGMTAQEVSGRLGPGKLLSESVSNEGLKTQRMQYETAGHVATVTFVNGVVVAYEMKAR